MWWRRERDDLGRRRKGTWSQSYGGTKFWPMDPRADEVHFRDMVIGVCREGRYGNQTSRPYMVGKHLVLVSEHVERIARERGWPEDLVLLAAREGLLHDGSEAWIGDLVRPLKHQPQLRGYRKAEGPIQRCVFERFGVHPTPQTSALVKEVDNRIVVDEIHALMRSPWMYLQRHDQVQGLGAKIQALDWKKTVESFVSRFVELNMGYAL